MNRIDLHLHLLPGVDDGPADLGDALALAADAVADGTAVAVATPHVRQGFVEDVAELPQRMAALREELRRARIALDLRAGGELSHTMVGRLLQSELETIALGPPGARWILLEAPFAGFTPDFHAAAQELRDRGFGVVIAHPERAAGGADLVAVRREVHAGSLLQVNLWSLAGRHGDDARDRALQLVARGLASVVASDAHADWRRPLLSAAELELAAGLGGSGRELLARALTEHGPRALLEAGLARPARLAPVA